MSEENCRLVFTGRIVDGMQFETVHENLAAIFKTDIEKIRKKFSHERTLIKKRMDAATCRKIQKRLLEAGAICDIESDAAEEAVRQAAPGHDTQGIQDLPDSAANPYAAPRAELKQEERSGTDGFTGPLKKPAGRGAAWLFQAIALFLKSPFVWILTIICFFLIGLLQMIPILGPIAMTLLGPVFIAGLVLGARQLDETDSFRVGCLFQGFRQGLGQLLLLGLLFLAATTAAVLVSLAVSFAFAGTNLLNLPNQAAQANFSPMAALLMVLLMLAAFVPIMMGYWFAPALIAINEKPVFAAIALSFRACLRNILPFLIYSLVALGVGIAAGLLIGTLFAIFAAVGGGAGVAAAIVPVLLVLLLMLALMPIYVSSIYTSYKDVFYQN